MPKTTLGDMVQYFRNVCEVQRSRDLTDADLLRRFLADREGAAFAVLMQRHGPMVLGLCKRILGDLHSAEDAFQATFMVLVRRAASLRCTGSLGNWLYAAAKRIALKARAKAIARQHLERRVETMPRAEPIDESTLQELRTVLDEEIGKLPKKYRAAVILCHLESKSQEQAAKELGWPKGTLTSRVVRGRELLRQGLVRRGITLSAAAVVTALAQKATAAPVAAMLTLSTVKAATSVLAGEALAGVGLSAGAVALAEETMKGIFWMKAKVMLLVLLLGFGAAGAGLASCRGLVEKSQPAKTATAPVSTKQAAPAQEQGNEAEKLFRAMEQKIMAAKSLKVVFEADLGGQGNLKGSGLFAQGNKARLELTVEFQGKSADLLLVSDGKDLVERESTKPFKGVRLLPKRFNMDLVAILARSGGFFAVGFGQSIASKGPAYDFQVANSMKVSDFMLGPKDKVGMREARVIDYSMAWSINDQKSTKKVRLWLDTETILPLKRILKNGDNGEPGEEIYSEFSINQELDPKSFELPTENANAAGAKEKIEAKNAPVAPPRLDGYGDPLPEAAAARLGTIRWRPGSSRSAMFVPATNVLVSHSGISIEMRTWDTVTGRPLKLFSQTYQGGAFSGDGKFLLDYEGGMVDFASGQPLRQIGGYRVASALALSADGQIAAVGDPRGKGTKIILWETGSGKQLRLLEGHTATIRCVAFSPDAKVLASGSEDGTARLWEVATGKQMQQLGEPVGEVAFVSFAPDGKLLAFADGDGILHIWDLERGTLLRRLQSDSERFPGIPGSRRFGQLGAAFSPDGKLLACAGQSGRIVLWDPHTGKEIRQWAAHANSVMSVSFSFDGKLLASQGAMDNGIRLWEVATGKQLNADRAHTGEIRLLQFTADGKTVRSAGGDLKVLEWDAITAKERRLLFDGLLLPPPTAALGLIDFSADGKFVAFKEIQKGIFTIHLWDTVQGKELRTLSGHMMQNNKSMAELTGKFSPDGKWLASLGKDGMRLWDVGTGAELRYLEGVTALAFGQDSRTMFLAEPDNTVRHLDMDSGTDLQRSHSPPNVNGVFVVSPDGKYMANADNQQNVVVWAAETGTEIFRVGRNAKRPREVFYPVSLAFSPSSRVLAVGGHGLQETSGTLRNGEGAVQLWDMHTGQKIGEIYGPQGWIKSLAFSPDGCVLATGGDDSTILLWDLTGKPDAKSKSAALTAAEIESLWTDLGSDALKADKAIWALARACNQGVPLLSERLRPVPPADAQQVAKLIADLASDQFATRQKAGQALTDLGESAEAAMRKALKGNQPLEIRQRLEKILEKRDQDPEIIRRLRAIEALEHIGTPQARELLQTLATAAPHPRVAQAAAAALQRLGKR